MDNFNCKQALCKMVLCSSSFSYKFKLDDIINAFIFMISFNLVYLENILGRMSSVYSDKP